MRRHRMPEIREGGVNVTPLIDVVMCLIIFFMLVAKIGVSRGEVKSIDLPKTILGTKIENFGDPLTLNVQSGAGDTPEVTTLVDNVSKDIKVMDRINGQAVQPLQIILTAFKNTHPKDPKVIIRADRDLTYAQLEQVLLACATAA